MEEGKSCTAWKRSLIPGRFELGKASSLALSSLANHNHSGLICIHIKSCKCVWCGMREGQLPEVASP